MTPIRIQTRLDSETIHVPQLRELLGKEVIITVREADPLPPVWLPSGAAITGHPHYSRYSDMQWDMGGEGGE